MKMRVRSIKNCVELIRKEDPNSEITENFIRIFLSKNHNRQNTRENNDNIDVKKWISRNRTKKKQTKKRQKKENSSIKDTIQ